MSKPTHNYIDRPCTRVRKNSDGTSLVSFPVEVSKADDTPTPQPDAPFVVLCDQRTVSNKFLTNIQPKPNQPKLLTYDPADLMKFESAHGYVMSTANPKRQGSSMPVNIT